jgi:hypothetical protein
LDFQKLLIKILKKSLLLLISLLLCSLQQLRSQPVSYAKVDGDSRRVSLFARYNTEKLTEELTSGLESDSMKVRAIFIWMTHNIKYDAKAYVKGNYKTHSPKRILKRRKAMCADYSLLFNELCRLAGIEAVTVSGYTKAGPYKPDDKIFRPEHAWNAVNIDGSWKLLDVNFASGYIKGVPTWGQWIAKTFFGKPYAIKKMVFKREYKDEWFFRQPEKMVTDHLPGERMWQLLPGPVPLEVFEQHESVIRNYLDETGQEYPYSNHIDDFRTAKEKELWEGDSAYAFNSRNVMEQAVSYHNAAAKKLRDFGKGVPAENEEEDDPYLRLQLAIDISDSAKKLFMLATESSTEEFRLRNEKNNYRKKVANSDISAAKSFTTKTVEKFRTYGTKNKTYRETLKKQSRTYQEKAEKIAGSSLEKVKNNPSKASLPESIRTVENNNVLMVQNRDTMNLLSAENARLLGSTSGVLETMVKVNNAIFTNLGIVDSCTYFNCILRSNNYDNVDSSVIVLTLERQRAIQQLDSLLTERSKIISGFRLSDSITKARMKHMQLMQKNNARLYADNKKISREPEKEEENLAADKQLLLADMQKVMEKHEFMEQFLRYDQKAIKAVYKSASRIVKRIKKESTIEEDRFKNRQKNDKKRKEALKDDIKKGRKSCDNMKAYAKAMQKKVNAGR